MKAWELNGFGRENLRMVEKEAPSPGEGEVLLRVRAVSLNARDRLLVEGAYNPNLSFPMVQGAMRWAPWCAWATKSPESRPVIAF